jgi:hypothetical protein
MGSWGCGHSARGGQTGEYTPPDACATKQLLNGTRVRADHEVPGIEQSLQEVIGSGLAWTLDEVKYTPYSGQAGWSPDQVLTVACGAVKLSVDVSANAEALAVSYERPSEQCPNAFYVSATINALSSDGAINESIAGDLALEFHEAGAVRPSHIGIFAEQPVSAMGGAARPVAPYGTNQSDADVAAEALFRIESLPASLGLGAALNFVIPAGKLRYAEWRLACEGDE